MVEKVIMDSRSSVDIFYYDTFPHMDYKREDLSPSKEAIYSFTNTTTLVVGVINLKPERVSRTCQFIIVEVEFAFNAIMGRPFIHGIKVDPSSYHQCM